tara:strand:- start:2287 stop:3048 length:762 start_codon:yes stop_codon:yes gene_type:complete
VEELNQKKAQLLNYLYHDLSDHWWSTGMRLTAHAILKTHITEGHILEVGCGSGTFANELSSTNDLQSTIGIDINKNGLEHGKRFTSLQGKLAQGNFHNLPFATETLSLTIGLDAYDQTSVKLQHALAESHRTLQKNGLILVRVSAHPWLMGQHDISFGTGKRYTKHTICSNLVNAGFTIERCSYANMFMFFPAILMRIAINLGITSVTNQFSTHKAINYLLTKVLQIEAFFLTFTNLPTGLSIYVLARKKSEK